MDTPELVRYHNGSQYVVCLVQHGTKWSHAVWIDGKGLRVHKINSTERKFMYPYPYDISKGLNGLQGYASKQGASKQALAMIKQAIKEQG